MSDAPLAIPEPDPPPGRLDVTRLKDVDTATLRTALAGTLGLTVRTLAYAAAIWRELESRGENLAPLKQGICAHLSAIGAGQVLPETVVNFAGRPALLKKVAQLPVAQQRAIADGKLSPPEVRFRGNGRLHAPAISTKAAPKLPGEPTDAELDRQAEAEGPPKRPLEMLAAMIQKASPRDAAELVADAVRRCDDPAAVARALLPLVEQLTRPGPRKLVV